MGALREIGETPLEIKKAFELKTVDYLILPGVGHFAACAKILHRDGWVEELSDQVLNAKKPILGICLGMQLLAGSSEEGFEEKKPVHGLNFISGKVCHLSTLGCAHRIPHVGWNSTSYQDPETPVFDGIREDTDFYFVHSYAFVLENQNEIAAYTMYGVKISAAVRKNHIWGTQFHPEKSSRAGLRLLKNFLNLSSC